MSKLTKPPEEDIDDDSPAVIERESPFGDFVETHLEKDRDVSEMMSEFGEDDGCKVLIYIQRLGDTRFSYLASMQPSEIDLETLKNLYGGGHYKLNVIGRDRRKVRTIRCSIDHRFRPQAADVETKAGGTDTGMLQLLLSQADKAAAQQQQMMMLMMNAQAEAQKANAQVLAAAISAGRPSGGEPASRILEAFMPLLVQNGQRPPGGGPMEMIETLKAMKELAADDGGRKDDDDMLSKLLGTLGPVAAMAMSGGRSAPQPAALPPPQPPTPEQQFEAMVNNMLARLRQFTPALAKAAASNKEVQGFADMLGSFLDDQQYEILQRILERDDWVQQLFGETANLVIPHLEWFENLRQVILGEPEEDGQGEAAPVKVPHAQSPQSVSPGA